MTKFYLFGTFLMIALAMRLVLFGFSSEVKISQGPVVFEAVLKQAPQLNGRGQVLSFANVKVYTDFLPQYEAGERLMVEGKVDEKGRMYQAKVSSVSKVSGVSVAELRNRIANNIERILPKKEAILVQGTILGVDNIDYGFRQELINTGTIHVVVVSGQNMAIAAGIFLAFAKYLGRRLAVILALIGVLCYAAIAGFQPPVVRAAIMVSAATIATLFGRDIWPMWILMLAAYAIAFVNPAAVGEISFQLTFAATLGIMTLGKKLEKLILNFKFLIFNQNFKLQISNLLGASFAVATSAYLFTAPLIIYYFGRISLLAPLVNILVIEAVTPIMVLGFFLALASLIWLPAAQVLALIEFVPALYFVKVVEIFAAIPFGQAEFGQGNVSLLLTLYVVVLGITVGLYSRSSDK